MARIRTIKPEFWTSEQVMECALVTRLMFIGMWNFADDNGRMTFSPKKIKAQVFPADEVSASDVSGMLDELSQHGLIKHYSVDGVEYLQITGWKHQKIDRPQRCTIPEIGTDKADHIDDDASNDHRTLVELSSNARREIDEHSLQEGKGREGIGEENIKSASQPLAARGAANEFDRMLVSCSAALGEHAPADPVIGPIIGLVRKGYTEREIVDALHSESKRPRRKPIRTWQLWSEIIEPNLPSFKAAPPRERAPQMVHLGGRLEVVESLIIQAVTDWRADPASWERRKAHLGPAPGHQECKIPRRYIDEAST
jgi:hypothetical protein